MWYRKAKPGDKIVCINGEWVDAPGNDGKTPPPYFPAFGQVYTVEEIIPAFGTVLVKVVELFAAFEADAFKPVEPAGEKADRGMALLKQSLKPVSKPEKEGV